MLVRERLGAAWRVLNRDGLGAVVSKSVRQLARRADDFYGWAGTDFPLLWNDVADSLQLSSSGVSGATAAEENQKLVVGWVCLPPSAGSGGHTTLFRMVRAMEERGHDCVIFLYDRDSEDVDRHIRTIRSAWPELRAEVRSARPGIDGVDAVVASSWETAHVIARRADPAVKRFYFVQDYEPFFYPRGPLWELAEDTYRFGYFTIALGRMVGSCLESFAGVEPDGLVPFGCDTTVYRDLHGNAGGRSGVVFYAKKTSDRRGYWLAKAALEKFHQAHPEQEIHVVGDTPAGWSIPVTAHGSISPQALNTLYNQALAGIALSFTNISLAAEEMLAAGAIPVVNDSPMARLDLTTDGPMWVAATPEGIAAGLSRIVEWDDAEHAARRDGADIRQGWEPTGRQVAELIEGALANRAGDPTTAVRSGMSTAVAPSPANS